MPAENQAAPPTSAAGAANYFLDKGHKEPFLPIIDQMKLQKLLFYSHAWHLAMRYSPLFAEDFEAWPWGPVVRDIYFQTRDFGRGPVTCKLKKVSLVNNNNIMPDKAIFETPNVTDANLQSFLDSVWESHKSYTGIQLSNATHLPGEPWTVISEIYNGELDHKPTIPNDLIADIFKRKIIQNVAS